MFDFNFNFDKKKINFKENLSSGISGKVYPYQKGPSDKKWVVKHIAHRYNDHYHHVNKIVLGFNCDHLNVLPSKGYSIEFCTRDIYVKLPRMTSSLKKVIETNMKDKSWIPEATVVKYFYAITKGLQYLHKRGIPHGDVKPDNLLLDENDILKIADFGLDDEFSYIIDKAGTRSYVAPESRDKNTKLKEKDLLKADYWSLGMVMLELCNLDLKDLSEMQNQADVTEKVHKLRERYKDRYKGELFDLILRLLQWEPSKRINLEDVQKDLETKYPEIIQKEIDLEISEHPEFKKLKDNVKNRKIELEKMSQKERSHNEIVAHFDAKIKEPQEIDNNYKTELERMLHKINIKKPEVESETEVKQLQETIKHLELKLKAISPKFEGQWIQGKVEGRAVFTWPDGSRYEGDFHKGLRQGSGTFRFSDGRKYVGGWKNDKKDGQGTFTWPDGDKYVGKWKNDLQEGQGIFNWSDGDRYEGEFRDGLRYGKGTITHSDGRKYVGEWKNEQKYGHGVFTWPSGERYEGEFQDDLCHGTGTYIFSNGSQYVGNWNNDSRAGKGTFTWPNGKKYTGYWNNGEREGQGICTSPNGNKYDGQWGKDMREGQGTFTWRNGNKFVGQWSKNKQEGKGSLTWPNGERYEGEVQGDQCHGFGTYIYTDGRKESGQWKNGKREKRFFAWLLETSITYVAQKIKEAETLYDEKSNYPDYPNFRK